jgi:DNA polymerase-3 subunit alpha
MASASILQDIGILAARERASSQVSLFGDTVKMEDPDLIHAPKWSVIDTLNHELSAVGFYLGGHPLDEHAEKGALSKSTKAIEIDEKFARSGKECKMNLAGVVLRKQERLSKRGKKFAFVALSDPTGEYEVLFTENILMANRDYLTPGNLIQLKVKAEGGDGDVRLFAEGVTPFNAKPQELKVIGLDIRLRNANVETLDALQNLLEQLKNAPYQTSGFIRITAPLDDAREAQWKLKGSWGVDLKIQKAIKANQSVELIEEVAA